MYSHDLFLCGERERVYACNLGEEEDHTKTAKKCGGSDFKIDGKIESWAQTSRGWRF